MYINIYICIYIYVDLKRLVKIVVQLALIMVKIVIYNYIIIALKSVKIVVQYSTENGECKRP